jgi:hypothetical protein
MGPTIDTVVAGAAVAVALVWAARAVWKSTKTKGVCSSCGSSGECPIAQNPELLTELGQKGRLNHLDSCQPGGPTCQELLETLENEPRVPAPPTKTT